MTAEVLWWDERRGIGTARMTWPRGGRVVTLHRAEFRAAAIRSGKQRAGLKAGDGITFVGVAAGTVARRIVRTERYANCLWAQDDDGHAFPLPPPSLPPSPVGAVDLPPDFRVSADTWPEPTTHPRRCMECGAVFVSAGLRNRACPRCLSE